MDSNILCARHAFATLMLSLGVDLFTVSKLSSPHLAQRIHEHLLGFIELLS